MAQQYMTELPVATSLDGTEYMWVVQSGTSKRVTVSEVAGSDINGIISVKDYGATGDGVTDDTTAIQRALAAAAGLTLWWPAGTYKVAGSGSYLFLMNTPTNMITEGQNCVYIDISDVDQGTDVFRITPTGVRAGMTIGGFNVFFVCATDAPARDFINITTSGADYYIAFLDVFNITVSGTVGGVASGIYRNVLRIDNAGANVGGGVFLSKFHDNNWVSEQETVYLDEAGDSLWFYNNHIRSNNSQGFYVRQIAGAGNFVSEDNNVTCKQGSHLIDSGAAPIISDIIEQTGTNTSGAVINLRGAVRKIDGALVTGCQIQEPSSLGDPICINVDNVDGAVIGENPLVRRDAAGTHINVVSNASNTVINLASRFFNGTAVVEPTIVDAGTNTGYQTILSNLGTATSFLRGGYPASFTTISPGDLGNLNAQVLLGNYSSAMAPPAEVVPSSVNFQFSTNQLQLKGFSGDVSSSANSTTLTIGTAVVSNTKLATVGAHTFKGNNTATTAAPLDLTVAETQTELLSGVILGGSLFGVNMNTTADQAITIVSPTTNYRILQIVATNPSGALGTAVGGIYTEVSKGGTEVVPAAQIYSALATSSVNTTGSALILGTANTNTLILNKTTIYFSLTTPNGTTTTMNLRAFIMPFYS